MIASIGSEELALYLFLAIATMMVVGFPISAIVNKWHWRASKADKQWRRMARVVAIALIVIISALLAAIAYLRKGMEAAFGIFVLSVFGVGLSVFFGLDRPRRIRKMNFGYHSGEYGDESVSHQKVIKYLKQGVENVYYKFYEDWSNLDYQSMRGYMDDKCAKHMELIIRALRDGKRQNIITVKHIDAVRIYGSSAIEWEPDEFTAAVTVEINDVLINSCTGHKIYESTYARISDRWTFAKKGGTYVLSGIGLGALHLSGMSYQKANRQIEIMAENSGLFYLEDFRTIMLPSRGQLYRTDGFRCADVNNHVIGALAGTGRFVDDATIYQIYTYSGKTDSPYSSHPETVDDYLVGQIALPRTFDDILIRRKSLLAARPEGMYRIETESGDFNDKFEVFAADDDRVSALELLNPKVMMMLIGISSDISLEIVDNFIYFYIPLHKATWSDYRDMLVILQTAYCELKM